VEKPSTQYPILNLNNIAKEKIDNNVTLNWTTEVEYLIRISSPHFFLEIAIDPTCINIEGLERT